MSLKRRNAPAGSLEGSPKDNSEGSPEGSSEDNSEGSPERSSEDNSEGSPEGSSEDNSEGSPKDNSEGSAGEDSGSGSSPPPDTTPEHTVSVPFTDDDVTSENLASMISKVKNGGYIFLGDEEKAGKRIGGYFGNLLTMYLGRATYIISAVQRWIEKSVPSILDVIESGLSEDEYSKVLPGLKKQFGEADDQFRIESINIAEAITDISENVHPITFNLLYLSRSFQASFASCWAYIGGLRIQLKKVASGKTLYVYLTDIHNTLKDFLDKYHNPNYKEISWEFETGTLSRVILPTHPNSE
ncbi:hypothetical protein BASA50_005818 [Batrachochytrium salamandrivorans]|uniref:Uncharacterized protein n=1 Tax=Batrachochytrium salamandrivorans TaxID=1357716 RepID=A0ABQ8FES6_9FUNG|nr:hypothetical protein BASA50_005818 [Batrachochytrium salamandrivorans]